MINDARAHGDSGLRRTVDALRIWQKDYVETHGENADELNNYNNMDPWNNNKSQMHSIQFNQPEEVMSNSEVTGREQSAVTCRQQTRQAVISSKTELCGELD